MWHHRLNDHVGRQFSPRVAKDIHDDSAEGVVADFRNDTDVEAETVQREASVAGGATG